MQNYGIAEAMVFVGAGIIRPAAQRFLLSNLQRIRNILLRAATSRPYKSDCRVLAVFRR